MVTAFLYNFLSQTSSHTHSNLVNDQCYRICCVYALMSLCTVACSVSDSCDISNQALCAHTQVLSGHCVELILKFLCGQNFHLSCSWQYLIVFLYIHRYGSPHNVDHNYQLLARYYMKMFNGTCVCLLCMPSSICLSVCILYR